MPCVPRVCALAAIGMMLLAPVLTARGADDQDLRSVADAFTRALNDGDAGAARKYAAPGDDAARWIDQTAKMTKAAKRLRELSASVFGADQQVISASPLGVDFDGAAVERSGDKATVTPRQGAPARFVRIDGAWRIDLGGVSPEYAATAERTAAAIKQTTDEVQLGRYTTAGQARAALLKRIQAARAPAARTDWATETQPSRRRVPQARDGTLVLWARDATDVGHCRIDNVSDVQCVTGWTEEHDTLKWEAAIKTYRVPGLYEVMVTYACDPGAGGSEYVIESGNQHVTGKTTVTGESGGWPQFNSEAIGTLRFDRPGDVSITVRATKKAGHEVMHLRSIVLKPATADQVAERVKLASPAPAANADGRAPTICVDISELPDLEDWGYGARAYCRKWYTVIDDLLHTDGFTPPRCLGIRVILDPHSVGFNDNGGRFQMTAYTTPGNTIIVFHTWALPNDYGMEVHEMSHVIQKYPRYEFWVVEGISDYIRYYVVEPGSKAAAFDPSTAHYKNGYQASSAFLNWMEHEYRPPRHTSIISRLNNALRHDRYNAGIFKDMTGKDVDELWDEFKKTLEGAKDK